MVTVLKVQVIGVDPDIFDLEHWGVTAEVSAIVSRMIVEGEAALECAKYDVETVLIALDAPLDVVFLPRLKARARNCEVAGGGIRKPPELLDLFERVINPGHFSVPGAAIACNSRPDDLRDAVGRRVDVGDFRPR